MKKYIDDYKAILTNRNRLGEDYYSLRDIIDIVISFIIITGVFTLLGYTFNQLENIQYVFFMQLSIVSVLTFLIVAKLYYKEEHKENTKLKFNVAIIHPIFQVVGVLTLSNSVLFITLFKDDVSVVLFIITSISAVIIIIFNIQVSKKVKNVSHIKIIRTSIILYLTHRFIGYIIYIENILLTYIISTLIIVSILLGLRYLYKFAYNHYKDKYINSFSIIIGMLLIAFFLNNTKGIKDAIVSYDNEEAVYHDLIYYKLNIVDEIELGTNFLYLWSNLPLKVDNQYYLNFGSESTLYVMDESFNQIKTIDYTDYDFDYIYENEGFIYAEQSASLQDPIGIAHDYRELYILNEDDEFELVIQLWIENFSKVFLLENEIIHFEYSDFWANSSGNFVSYHFGTFEETRLKADSYLTTEIIYQDIDDVIYTKDGYLMKDFSNDSRKNYGNSATYHNYKKIVIEENTIIFYEFDDFLNNREYLFKNELPTKYRNRESLVFMFYNDKYLVSSKPSRYFKTYDYLFDDEGKIVLQIENTSERIYLDEDYIIHSLRNPDTNEMTYSILDYNEPASLKLLMSSQNLISSLLIISLSFMAFGFSSVSFKEKA